MPGPSVKTEGGNKRGHSQMDHWDSTADVKREARKARRRQDKAACREEA